jgi:tetratricopeptide (TPR) repeat protein
MGSRLKTKLRSWAVNLALAAASLTLTMLAFEGAARLWVKVPAPVQLRDGVFVSSLPLINGHPSCRWTATVTGAPLPLARRPDEVRVFVFGESSVQGSPWEYLGSPATMLRDQLRELLPERAITVVNMGRSCSSMMDSYYYLLSIAPYKPDIVIFYQGSNDRFDVESERCLVASSPFLHAAWRFLAKRSRLMWAARAMAPQAIRRWENNSLSGPVPPGMPRCDPKEAFSRWTRILAGTAKDLGAKVIVTTPVRNPVLPIELKAWSRQQAPVSETIKNLDARYRKILRCELAPSCDPAHDIQAALPEGKAEIEERADAWKATAAAQDARFVDFRALLSQAAIHGESTGHFFVGETHLTLEGYWLLSSLWAGAVADSLSDRDIPKANPTRPNVQRYIDDLAAHGNRVEDTFYREGFSYLRARMMLLAVPCLTQAARRQVPEAQLILARLRQDVGLAPGIPSKLKALWAKFNLDAHLKVMPSQNGPTSAPAAVAAMAPVVPAADIRAAMDSFVKGDLREAEIAVTRILRKDPANETGLLLRGSLFLQTKRLGEALQDFDRIIQRNSSPPEVLADALSSRGRTLALMGRQSDAVKDYARGLSIAPQNWKQRAAIEELLRGTDHAEAKAPAAVAP